MSKTPNTVATDVTKTGLASELVRRRNVVAGVGIAGAAAAAAAVLPLGSPQAPTVDPKTASASPDAKPSGGGYQLTDHVQHYYKTARI
jgi:hypothetical protein